MRVTRNSGTMMVAAMVSLFALGRPVLAQGVGDLVRVTTPRETVVGAISEMDGSGFKLLLPEGWHWEVARNEVEQLEVSTGTKRSTWRGLGFGVGAGLVVSLVRMVGAPKRTYCGNQPSIRTAIMCNLARARRPAPLSDSEILTGTTIFVGVVGAVVGTLVKRDRWEPIRHESPGAFTLDPVLDTRSGPDGRPAVILGTRIRF